LVTIKINISKAIVFLAIKVNNKIYLLFSLVKLALKRVGLLTVEHSLESFFVDKVNLPGRLFSFAFVVIKEESASGLGLVVTLEVKLNSWWPVRVILTVGHELKVGSIEITFHFPLITNSARVLATKEETKLIVNIDIEETISKLASSISSDNKFDRLYWNSLHELSDVLEFNFSNSSHLTVGGILVFDSEAKAHLLKVELFVPVAPLNSGHAHGRSISLSITEDALDHVHDSFFSQDCTLRSANGKCH